MELIEMIAIECPVLQLTGRRRSRGWNGMDRMIRDRRAAL